MSKYTAMKAFGLWSSFFMAWVRGKNPVFEVFLKGKRVLDVGCGEGKIVALNPEKFSGIDINQTMVSRLQAQGLDVHQADVQHMPFQDKTFDVVHCSNVIEHLTPIEAYSMMKEMHRVLKVGGGIVLITPMPQTIWNTFGHTKPYPPIAIGKLFRDVSRESFDTIKDMSIEVVFYYGRWSMNKVLFLLSTIIAQVTPWSRGAYLMIIRKNA
jgi:ubiquinone/menaquinone biosynthesis C-methylase UbiE